MSRNISSLVAVFGLGIGLVHLAVGAGSPLPFFIVFVASGVVQFVWAILTLVRSRVPAPRVFAVVTLVPVAFWAVSITLGLGGLLPLGPLAAASTLSVVAVGTVLFSLRRRANAGAVRADASRVEPVTSASATAVPVTVGPSSDDGEHPWRFIGTLAASAAIVSALVTPALSGTWAGQYAVPHGSHDIPGLEIPDEHGGH